MVNNENKFDNIINDEFLINKIVAIQGYKHPITKNNVEMILTNEISYDYNNKKYCYNISNNNILNRDIKNNIFALSAMIINCIEKNKKVSIVNISLIFIIDNYLNI